MFTGGELFTLVSCLPAAMAALRSRNQPSPEGSADSAAGSESDSDNASDRQSDTASVNSVNVQRSVLSALLPSWQTVAWGVVPALVYRSLVFAGKGMVLLLLPLPLWLWWCWQRQVRRLPMRLLLVCLSAAAEQMLQQQGQLRPLLQLLQGGLASLLQQAQLRHGQLLQMLQQVAGEQDSEQGTGVRSRRHTTAGQGGQ